ncbi:hypothetical protein [Pseudobacteriovorax antillogorgiicola]|uniref:Response regulatory domain-containing protein n=1 Tax=Pseudobacteriovorax antillogorgiicola TaxID=1513793 RepID=A0A1Y6CDN3_9BACT|nr:hypothetical protein [Pseudobacteriovorax antillogorgiicola]TCS47987.1 hypothetical protein EDD56_11998 [Pseudobacteriovorax antillogorgiicola]SMF58287.1 hypothetical protein SAMN06296036_11999 [Pseudobacteriovorax antillogorgiicola]
MDDPKNPERPVVLVVEDDDAQRELLIGRLEKQGYEVKEAAKIEPSQPNYFLKKDPQEQMLWRSSKIRRLSN